MNTNHFNKIFELTKDHIELIRNFNLRWQSDEYGALEVDPKRPYGNSAVEEDIYEITSGRCFRSLTEEARKLIEESVFPLYRRLHQETLTALQVILDTQSFTPGRYVFDEYTHQYIPLKSNQ